MVSQGKQTFVQQKKHMERTFSSEQLSCPFFSCRKKKICMWKASTWKVSFMKISVDAEHLLLFALCFKQLRQSLVGVKTWTHPCSSVLGFPHDCVAPAEHTWTGQVPGVNYENHQNLLSNQLRLPNGKTSSTLGVTNQFPKADGPTKIWINSWPDTHWPYISKRLRA